MIFNKKIGILGGGQLGKMLGQAGSPWDLNLHFLDKSNSFPAANHVPNFHIGDFTDYDDVLQFGREMDVISIEIEKVNLEALVELENLGKCVIPSSQVVRTIRDKGLQKQFYKANSIPTSNFTLYEDKHSVWTAILNSELEYPFVQKARRDGYDGRGIAIIRGEDDLPKLMDVPCVVEDLVEMDKELAVIVARNNRDQLTCFPMVEMEFDPEANLVNFVLSPARVEESIIKEAEAITIKMAKSMNLVGLLAVEFFLDTSGNLLVNEAAPRPHNSGHITIEACNYSQYDIHLRCLLDLPLPKIRLMSAAGMLNVLGGNEGQGAPKIHGLQTLLITDAAYLHWYGKEETRPMRKMGHITVLGQDVEEVHQKLSTLSDQITVGV